MPSACSGTARFSFHELCARPLGAADYIAIAREFHTVFITGIPSFSMQANTARRQRLVSGDPATIPVCLARQTNSESSILRL